MPADVADPPGSSGWSGWSGTARVVRGREVLEERCVGPAAGPDGPPCGPATRYQAGSIGKLVLAAAVLRLVEQGELELGRPVTRWLATAPAAWRAITLHQLLSHTSGLGHWGDVPELGAALLSAPPPRDALVALVERAPLVHAPGTGWRYSGPGFLVAALVVEAATGRAYGDVAAELVLGPAGLTGTTSGRFPVGDADVAVGHRRGELIEVHEGFARLPGTGDLWTTVGDLVRLNQALRSGRVLRPEVASQLWTAHAELPRTPAAGDQPMVVEAYGYGTFLGRLAGRPARINPGDNPGYQSLLAYLPDRDVDLAVLANEDAPSVDTALRGLTSL